MQITIQKVYPTDENAFDADLTIDGVEGSITLWPNEGRPTVGRLHPLDACGTPLEVWCSDSLHNVLGKDRDLQQSLFLLVDERARREGLR